VGRIEKVLVEAQSKRRQGEISGRTDGGRMVNLMGEADLIGKVVKVRITKAMANSIFGELA